MVFICILVVLLDIVFMVSTIYSIVKRIARNHKEAQRIYNEAMQNIQETGAVLS